MFDKCNRFNSYQVCLYFLLVNKLNNYNYNNSFNRNVEYNDVNEYDKSLEERRININNMTNYQCDKDISFKEKNEFYDVIECFIKFRGLDKISSCVIYEVYINIIIYRVMKCL